MSTRDRRPLLLLVRTGHRELREYLLRPIAERFRVHALTVREPSWELPYLTGHDRLPETLDREALLAAVRRINDAEPLDGIMCWQETHMPQVAYVADMLGLPSAGQDAARRCRDKRLTREALAAAGVPQVVGAYADGEEISVDSAVHAGTAYPMCLARKTTGSDPYFIETGHLVDANDPLRRDPALRTLLQQAHDAIEFGFGVTHTEIRLTPAGPQIIEINGRLGGDMVPYLGLRATGIDAGLNAARVACGLEPELAPDRRLAAGVRLFDATEHQGLISSIAFEPGGLPDTVDRVVVLARPDDRRPAPVRDPVDSRIAYATAVAPTGAECVDALDAATRALHVVTGSDTDRLPAGPPDAATPADLGNDHTASARDGAGGRIPAPVMDIDD